MTLRFSNGVEFKLIGGADIESRPDGLFLIGGGKLVPIESESLSDTMV